jgi:ribosomal protein S18 acetylase RimI-like enzyme
MLTAARSHLTRGIWDVSLGLPEQDCLIYLEKLALTNTVSWGHYSTFLIAEVGKIPAAALCGYDPNEADAAALMRAMDEVADQLGLNEAQRATIWENFAPISTCISDAADGAWIIENVATLPEYRRKGLVNMLVEQVLERGRARGYKLAQLTILIGNTPAQKAYEKIGFRSDIEKRHPNFDAAIGVPGMMRMLLAL